MWKYLDKKHSFNLAESKQQKHLFHAIPQNPKPKEINELIKNEIDTTQVRLCFQVSLALYLKGKLLAIEMMTFDVLISI